MFLENQKRCRRVLDQTYVVNQNTCDLTKGLKSARKIVTLRNFCVRSSFLLAAAAAADPAQTDVGLRGCDDVGDGHVPGDPTALFHVVSVRLSQTYFLGPATWGSHKGCNPHRPVK